MKYQHIIAFLRKLGAEPHGGPDDRWIQAPCPLAPYLHSKGRDRHPSFGVKNTGKAGPSPCKCFSCGQHGSPLSLLYRLRDLGAQHDYRALLDVIQKDEQDIRLAWEAEPYEERYFGVIAQHDAVVPYPEAMRKHLQSAYGRVGSRAWVHWYLRARSVSWRVARMLDLRWDARYQRIVFPVRDREGTLCGLHGRAVYPRPKIPYWMYRGPGKQTNPHVWLGEHWLDPARPVVLVESVFDLARVLAVYRNTACALHASVPERKVERLADCLDIVLMFDGDAAGDRGCEVIRQTLRDSRVRQIHLPPGTDPGDCHTDRIADWLASLGLRLDRSEEHG